MADNTDLVVTGLDYDIIRANLRTFISSKPEFTDYDFNDSALGTLLDLLAYNTYYQAFYANMATNEGFLDTAQLYDSVVSKAKALGYTPTSARGATANVQLIFTSSIANTTFRSIRVPKDTQFSAVINGASYIFVAPQTYTITANSVGGFAQHINITEGVPLTHRFIFNRATATSFVLPNDNVDTSSITVTVTTSGNTQSYIKGDNILTVNSSSQVYFVDADKEQRFKVYFGDGVIGKLPATSSTVSVSYRVCNGSTPNGADSYTLIGGSIDAQTGVVIVPVGRASGGAAIEGIESMRFNAPLSYQTQNRCVTISDYERILLRENPDIQAVSVWGGEDNVPPIYGKIFISSKPKTGTLFSTTRKNDIRSSILKYNVQSIDVEIVDPTYLYIVPEVDVRYNPSNTSKTPGELADLVSARIVEFESTNLSRFGQKFRYSRFLDFLDSTDQGIVGTNATIRLRKTFVPSLLNINTYTLKFNNGIQRLGSKELVTDVSAQLGFGCLTSSSFSYAGYDSFFDDNGVGVLRTYHPSKSGSLNRVYTNYTAGTVDYDTGEITINNFVPTSFSGNELSIIVAPINPNITPIRNQILLMSQSIINVVDDNTNKVVAVATNTETIGQTATLLTPTGRLYNF
jgi:hypothetical protein